MDKFITKKILKDSNDNLLSFVFDLLDGKVSKRKAKSLIENGLCFLNNKIELISSKILKKNDFIKIYSNWDSLLDLANDDIEKDIKILYEDAFLIAIEKPIKIASDDPLIKKIAPYLIHRLDKNTSGVLLLSKSQDFFKKMQKMFMDKKVSKKYIAVVDGKVLDKKFKVEGKIYKKSFTHGQTIYGFSKKEGKHSLSFFESVESCEKYSVLYCYPITGRTHQIRVHLMSRSHPILGDFLYSKSFKYKNYSKRLFLHSLQISFVHPETLKKIEIKSNIPKDFLRFIGKNP